MTKRLRVSLFLVLAMAMTAVPVTLMVAPVNAQEPKPQEEFIPIDQLPPQDQLPAAPLLVTAYSFVVLALFVYLISVSRRLGVVQRELDRLQADVKHRRT